MKMESEKFEFSNNNNNNNHNFNNTNSHSSDNGNAYGNDYSNATGYNGYNDYNVLYTSTSSYPNHINANGSNTNQISPEDILMDFFYNNVSEFQLNTVSLFNDSVLFSTLPEGSNAPYPYGEEYSMFQALHSMAQQPATLAESSSRIDDSSNNTQVMQLFEPNTQQSDQFTETPQVIDSSIEPSTSSHTYLTNSTSTSTSTYLTPPSPGERSIYAVSPSNSIMNIEYDIESMSSEPSSSSSPKLKKRYYCDLCPGHFGRIQDLNRHMSSKHSKKKYFVCEHCQKGLSRPDALKRHQKTEKCKGKKI